jgi:hypothetical protein
VAENSKNNSIVPTPRLTRVAGKASPVPAALAPSSKTFYGWAFRAQYAEKRGAEFQQFVGDILEARYGSGFRRVKAGGKRGDEKNDGYIPDAGTYLQVHAPSSLKESELAKKIDEDFEGARASWDVKVWVFVHNDLAGMSSVVNHKLDELNGRHKGVSVVAWGREELRRQLFALPESDIAAVLGATAPSIETMAQLGADDLRQVVAHVVAQPYDPLASVRPVPRDKAERNRLSDAVRDLLEVGMSRMDAVEHYFATDPDPAQGSRVAAAMRREYERLRDAGMCPDDVFQELWVHAGGRLRSPTTRHESAVLAVLAYFFWTCDIFERTRQREGES